MSPWITFSSLGLLIYLAYYDWKNLKIPNKVILPAVGAAIFLRLIIQDLSWDESFYGMFFAGGIFFMGAWMGKMGGGDFKLMALVGFVFGLWHVFWILWILAIFLLITWLVRGNRPVPFAPYVLVAAFLVYFSA